MVESHLSEHSNNNTYIFHCALNESNLLWLQVVAIVSLIQISDSEHPPFTSDFLLCLGGIGKTCHDLAQP